MEVIALPPKKPRRSYEPPTFTNAELFVAHLLRLEGRLPLTCKQIWASIPNDERRRFYDGPNGLARTLTCLRDKGVITNGARQELTLTWVFDAEIDIPEPKALKPAPAVPVTVDPVLAARTAEESAKHAIANIVLRLLWKAGAKGLTTPEIVAQATQDEHKQLATTEAALHALALLRDRKKATNLKYAFRGGDHAVYVATVPEPQVKAARPARAIDADEPHWMERIPSRFELAALDDTYLQINGQWVGPHKPGLIARDLKKEPTDRTFDERTPARRTGIKGNRTLFEVICAETPPIDILVQHPLTGDWHGPFSESWCRMSTIYPFAESSTVLSKRVSDPTERPLRELLTLLAKENEHT